MFKNALFQSLFYILNAKIIDFDRYRYRLLESLKTSIRRIFPKLSRLVSRRLVWSRNGLVWSRDVSRWNTITNGIWHTRLNRTNFKLSTCTCPSNFRDYICKHILGVAAITKINPIANEAKTVCIEQKAPRGRPAKAKKALEYQAQVTQIPD